LIEKSNLITALKFVDLEPDKPLVGRAIVVFLQSCTKSRMSDHRAADILKDRKVNPKIRMLVVPGLRQVKRQAEAMALHRIFREAGAEFHEVGCPM